MLKTHLFSSVDDAFVYLAQNHDTIKNTNPEELIIVENTEQKNYVAVFDNIDSYIFANELSYDDTADRTGIIENTSSIKYNTKTFSDCLTDINNEQLFDPYQNVKDTLKLNNILNEYGYNSDEKKSIKVKQNILDIINDSSNVNPNYINNYPNTSYLDLE